MRVLPDLAEINGGINGVAPFALRPLFIEITHKTSLPTLKNKLVRRIIAVLSILVLNLPTCGIVWGNDSEGAPHKTVKQNYEVKVGLFPMATNPGAQLQPHTLILATLIPMNQNN